MKVLQIEEEEVSDAEEELVSVRPPPAKVRTDGVLGLEARPYSPPPEPVSRGSPLQKVMVCFNELDSGRESPRRSTPASRMVEHFLSLKVSPGKNGWSTLYVKKLV